MLQFVLLKVVSISQNVIMTDLLTQIESKINDSEFMDKLALILKKYYKQNDDQPISTKNDLPATWEKVIFDLTEYNGSKAIYRDEEYVYNDLVELTHSIANLNSISLNVLVEECYKRDELGLQRYGTRLQPFNGRDSLKDALQEILDLLVYMKNVVLEKEMKNVTKS